MTNVTLLSGHRYATIKETFTYHAGFREDIMSIIIDKTFLLLYGLFPLFTLPVNASFVLCFFKKQGFTVFGVKYLTGQDIVNDGGR